MSRGINKVFVLGRLGQDPEVRHMPSGGAVTNLSIATEDGWKDRETGEQKSKTEWHRVVLFGRVGEIAAEYLRKGSQCHIEGRLQTRKWQDKTGADRWSTEIVGNELHLLGGKGDSGGAMPGPGVSQGAPENQSRATPQPRPVPQPPVAADEFGDDIPF